MHKSERGVTLVEVLMALVIFVIAGAGILGSYLSSHQLAENATGTMRAVDHLEDLMERIHSTAFNAVTTTFPNGVANGGATNYAAIVGGYSLQGEQITVTYPSVAAGRLEVLATDTWTYRGRAHTVRLSTLRTSG